MHIYLLLKKKMLLYDDSVINNYDVVMSPRAFESWFWGLNALFSYERSEKYV